MLVRSLRGHTNERTVSTTGGCGMAGTASCVVVRELQVNQTDAKPWGMVLSANGT